MSPKPKPDLPVPPNRPIFPPGLFPDRIDFVTAAKMVVRREGMLMPQRVAETPPRWQRLIGRRVTWRWVCTAGPVVYWEAVDHDLVAPEESIVWVATGP